MTSLLTWFSVVFVGLMLQTSSMKTSNFNQSFGYSRHQRESRPGKRNTKFIIPALISHMYHQKLDDFPLSTILNRPSCKTVSKQDNEKRQTADHLEHRIIVGNPKKDEHVRNVPKTKCPGVKRKEPVLIEVQSHRKGGQSGSKLRNNDNPEGEGNVIQVNKHFSPLARNWYAGPSVMWPAPYPNNYGMPLEYPHLRYSRPLYPGRSALQQEGIIQHIMGQPRRLSSESKGDGPNKNLVAQEKKFMVTNITKYVLDFYCPHCGGEISVSKNKNRGGLFNSDPGAITVNKGERDQIFSKDHTPKPTLSVTKIIQQ